ncbi:MAG: prephenate dehydratase domain-containing protein, partial [Firmicutes bacterium]|nr:prephenate dehydratase domain-containing protein [Bacillota bacterium]
MIYYLGPEGSYSHEAAFLVDDNPVPANSIKEVFRKSQTEKGIVPWENSLEGSVSETLDLLLETEVAVVGEVNIPISHCLLGYNQEERKLVYSHPGEESWR